MKKNLENQEIFLNQGHQGDFIITKKKKKEISLKIRRVGASEFIIVLYRLIRSQATGQSALQF